MVKMKVNRTHHRIRESKKVQAVLECRQRVVHSMSVTLDDDAKLVPKSKSSCAIAAYITADYSNELGSSKARVICLKFEQIVSCTAAVISYYHMDTTLLMMTISFPRVFIY